MDYDIMGRKTKESWTIDGTSYPIDYAYDNVGNVIKITYPDGKIIDLNYYPDARNLVRNIPNLIGTAQTDSFIYNGNSLSTEIRYGNGLNNYKQYDHRSRLITNIYGTTQGDINRKEIQYRYYSSGNIKTIIDGYVNQPLNYAYDGTSKLTSADVPSVQGITQTFVYDNAGNRIEDNVNNLYNYSKYDLTGNLNYTYEWGTYQQLTSKKNIKSGLTTNYSYTPDRLLTSVKEGEITKATYYYDALGRRIKAVEGNITTITLYAGNDIVYEIKKEDTTETKTRYLVLNGKYLAKMVGDEPNLKTYYYHTDHLGSIRAVSDSTGSIVGSYTYDPFGNVIQEQSYPDADRIRFTGKRLDSTGLYYFNARYYDPTIGRFISADPAREGSNWYVYCNNNPLMFVDPDGRTNYWYNSKGTLIKEAWSLFDFYFYEHEQGNVEMDGRNFYRCNSFETIYGADKEQRPILHVDITFQNDEFVKRLEASKPEKLMGFLETYKWIQKQSVGGVMDQKLKLNGNTLYLFDNTLFNSNEAGNIVWGARMYMFGFDQWYTKALAHGARLIGKQHKFDEAHDQRAIETGWGWAYMQDIIF